MSWINRVRNAIPFIAKRSEGADTLWHKCSGCGQMIFTREWEENLSVCPKCDHHGRIGPKARFDQLLDEGFTVLPTPTVREDPLKFLDTKKYTDRVKAARSATGETDALINARGTIGAQPIVLGVQDFAFMGGSMG
ncbi:MAG: acetyl-CoA carboxylase carboxyl transferase subunit beta, partial [Sphingobium sp.]